MASRESRLVKAPAEVGERSATDRKRVAAASHHLAAGAQGLPLGRRLRRAPVPIAEPIGMALNVKL